MDDTRAVRRFERFGDLSSAVERLSDRKRTSTLDALRQRFAFHQLEDEAVHIVELFQAIDSPDVGMIERGKRTRFPSERASCSGSRANSVGNILIATSQASSLSCAR